MGDPVIRTERLTLSRLGPDDAQALYAYRRDPEVCRYQSFEPGALADAEEFVAKLQGYGFDVPGTWFQFGIRRREDGELIGDIGARFPDDDPHQAEIGFTLSPAAQGRGLATEAVAGLLGHLLAECGKHRVFASVDPRNEPSVRLLERVGMRREAHHRASLWFKGEWVDDMIYAILSDEWIERGGDR